MPADLKTGGVPSMDYDTRNRRLVIFRPRRGPEPFKLWAWDPATDAWEDLGTGALPPEADARRPGVGRGMFRYDPVRNVFWTATTRTAYCGIAGAKCGGLSDTWAYRYRIAAAPAARAAPGRHPASARAAARPRTVPALAMVSTRDGERPPPRRLTAASPGRAPAARPAAGAPRTPFSISLTVTEPAGADRTEGVTVGVPLPPGIDPAGPWSLWQDDHPVSVQAAPLRHRTPWILVDFVAAVRGRRTVEYTLRSSASPAAAAPAPIDAGRADAYARTEVVDATSGETWRGVVTDAAWEAEGPVRWTRRLDGRYAEGLTYTLRLTWWAGAPQVRVVYTLRNAAPANQRDVKLRSARVILGSGARAARAALQRVPAAAPPDAVLEALPNAYPTMAGLPKALRQPGALDVDANGGFVVMDLSHFTATFVVGADAKVAAAPLVAMAPPAYYAVNGNLSSERWSTLQDEIDYVEAQGWSWSRDRLPTYPHTPGYTVFAANVDLHAETESDDCWQNLLMFLRSGTRGFWDRARGWCEYQRDEMARRTDGFAFAWDADGEGGPGPAGGSGKYPRPPVEIPLTELDRAYLRASAYGRIGYFPRVNTSHFWGWGLVDWALVTGDPEAVAAAVDLAEISRRHFGWRMRDLAATGRTGARALMLAIRVWEATGAPEWRDYVEQLVTLYTDAADSWREWAGHYLVPLPALGADWFALNPHHAANLDQAFERYVSAGGARAEEIRRRLVRMGDFALAYGAHRTWWHSSSTVAVTASGRHWLSGIDSEPPAVATINPYHTLTWVDTLVRAWRLTGERKYLEHAAFLHERATRHRYGQRLLTPPAVPFDRAGRFLNEGRIKDLYYPDNGHLQFAHLLFADAVAARLPPRPRPRLAASESRVPFGGSLTLTWAADGGATACTGAYGWSGDVPPAGKRTLEGLRTGRAYVLTCREPLQTVLVPVAVGAAAASERGLALRWSLDAADTDRSLPRQTTLIDRGGAGRNGSVELGTTVPGRHGEALALDGTKDHYARSEAGLKLPPAMTLATWIRFQAEQPVEATALGFGRLGYPRSVNLMLDGTALRAVLRFEGKDTVTLEASGAGDGQWHHVAVAFAPEASVLYVDGRQVAAAPRGPKSWDADRLYLGVDMALKRWARVALDEVRLYPRTLGPAEVSALAR
jgi:hypothetical protein